MGVKEEGCHWTGSGTMNSRQNLPPPQFESLYPDHGVALYLSRGWGGETKSLLVYAQKYARCLHKKLGELCRPVASHDNIGRSGR